MAKMWIIAGNFCFFSRSCFLILKDFYTANMDSPEKLGCGCSAYLCTYGMIRLPIHFSEPCRLKLSFWKKVTRLNRKRRHFKEPPILSFYQRSFGTKYKYVTEIIKESKSTVRKLRRGTRVRKVRSERDCLKNLTPPTPYFPVKLCSFENKLPKKMDPRTSVYCSFKSERCVETCFLFEGN